MKKYIKPSIFEVAAKAQMFQASNTLDKGEGGADPDVPVQGKSGMWDDMDKD